MTEERDCIFCWESDEQETLQPLFPAPGALSDVEPTAWVHKRCLEEYSNPLVTMRRKLPHPVR